MTDDEGLRASLRRLDPAAAPATSHPAPDLMEQIMSTPVTDQTSELDEPRRSRRTPWWVAAAAAAVLAGGAIGLSALLGDDAAPADPQSTLALSLPRGDIMASCIGFEVRYLKDMSPAFAGTVTEVTPAQVTIDVDRWYAGGSADRVTLAKPDPNSSASLDGVAFEEGERYLVTAAQGTVNGCGYSGLATPALEKSFDEAFPGSGSDTGR